MGACQPGVLARAALLYRPYVRSRFVSRFARVPETCLSAPNICSPLPELCAAVITQRARLEGSALLVSPSCNHDDGNCHADQSI